MPNSKKAPVTWLDAPEDQDYAAASDYLSLLLPPEHAAASADALKGAAAQSRKAKDILRASRLPLLTADNPHVASDLAKIARGRALSPILVLRGDLTTGRAAVVADGYHRVCASYLTDENTEIPLLLADLPPRP